MLKTIEGMIKDNEHISSDYLEEILDTIEEDFEFGLYTFINFMLEKNYDPNDYPVFEKSFLNKVYILIEEEAKDRKII